MKSRDKLQSIFGAVRCALSAIKAVAKEMPQFDVVCIVLFWLGLS